EKGVIARSRRALLDRATKESGLLDAEVDALWQAIPQQQKFRTQPIVATIEAMRKDLTAVPGTARTVTSTVMQPTGLVSQWGTQIMIPTEVAKEIPDTVARQQLSRQFNRLQEVVASMGTDVSPDSLLKLKQLWARQVEDAKGYAVTPKVASRL